MKAMILAAGRGERMRPLTDECPKPLLEAGGKPLIVRHLERLRAAGFTEVVINHAYLGHMIVNALGDGSSFGLKLRYSAETAALETAGGIAQALPLLGDAPFLVVNGDIFCDADFAALRQMPPLLSPSSDLAHLLMVDRTAHHPEGDFFLDKGRVREEGEPKLIFSGIGLYHPALFDGLIPGQPGRLAPLLRNAMRNDQIGGTHYRGVWVDIGTPQRLSDLNDKLASGAIRLD